MKKTNLLKIGLLSMVGLFTVSCGGSGVPQYDGTEVQGITETSILVGNTASQVVFNHIGIPFNQGLKAAFKAYNEAGGYGEKGLKIEFINRDDNYDPVTGATMTEKLVEEDKVFALVGHYGTGTVNATVEYIQEKGVPMVYAATGTSTLYNAKAEGKHRAVMPVQPIYEGEGEALLARAFAKTEDNMGLGATKVGVIYTDDDAGTSLYTGVKKQAESLGDKAKNKIVYVKAPNSSSDYSDHVNRLKAENCDVVIVASLKIKEIMSTFKLVNYDAKIITTYSNASATVAEELIDNGVVTENRPVYTTGWVDTVDNTYFFKPEATSEKEYQLYSYYVTLMQTMVTYYGYLAATDVDNAATHLAMAAFYQSYYDAYANYGVGGFSAEYWQFATDMYDWGFDYITENGEGSLGMNANTGLATTPADLCADAYAISGYIAGNMFIQGLERVEESGKELTWSNYVDAMESAPINVITGGDINFADGQRTGVQDFALVQYGLSATASTDEDGNINYAGELKAYSPIKGLSEVVAAIA